MKKQKLFSLNSINKRKVKCQSIKSPLMETAINGSMAPLLACKSVLWSTPKEWKEKPYIAYASMAEGRPMGMTESHRWVKDSYKAHCKALLDLSNESFKKKHEKKHSYYYQYLLFTNSLSVNKVHSVGLTPHGINEYKFSRKFRMNRRFIRWAFAHCKMKSNRMNDIHSEQKRSNFVSPNNGQSLSVGAKPSYLINEKTTSKINAIFLETIENTKNRRGGFFSFYSSPSFFLNQPKNKTTQIDDGSKTHLLFGLNNPYRKSFLCYWLLPLIGFVSNSYLGNQQHYLTPNTTNTLFMFSHSSRDALLNQSNTFSSLEQNKTLYQKEMKNFIRIISNQNNLENKFYTNSFLPTYSNNGNTQISGEAPIHSDGSKIYSNQVSLTTFWSKTKNDQCPTDPDKCFFYLENLNSLLESSVSGLKNSVLTNNMDATFSHRSVPKAQILGTKSFDFFNGKSNTYASLQTETQNKWARLRPSVFTIKKLSSIENNSLFLNLNKKSGTTGVMALETVNNGSFNPFFAHPDSQTNYTVPFKANLSLISLSNNSLYQNDGRVTSTPGSTNTNKIFDTSVFEDSSLIKQNPATSFTKASILLDKYLSLNKQENELKHNFVSYLTGWTKAHTWMVSGHPNQNNFTENHSINKDFQGHLVKKNSLNAFYQLLSFENFLTNYSLVNSFPVTKPTTELGTIFASTTFGKENVSLHKNEWVGSIRIPSTVTNNDSFRMNENQSKHISKKDKNELYFSILKSFQTDLQTVVQKMDESMNLKTHIGDRKPPHLLNGVTTNQSLVGVNEGQAIFKFAYPLSQSNLLTNFTQKENNFIEDNYNSINNVIAENKEKPVTTFSNRIDSLHSLNEKNSVSLFKLTKTNERTIFNSLNLDNDYYNLKNYLRMNLRFIRWALAHCNINFSIWQKIPTLFNAPLMSFNDSSVSNNRNSSIKQNSVQTNTNAIATGKYQSTFNTEKWNSERNTILSLLNNGYQSHPNERRSFNTKKNNDNILNPMKNSEQTHKVEKLLRSYLSIKGNKELNAHSNNTVNNKKMKSKVLSSQQLTSPILRPNKFWKTKFTSQLLTKNSLSSLLKGKLKTVVFKRLNSNETQIRINQGLIPLNNKTLFEKNRSKGVFTAFKSKPILRVLPNLLSTQNGSSVLTVNMASPMSKKLLFSPRLLIKNRLLFKGGWASPNIMMTENHSLKETLLSIGKVEDSSLGVKEADIIKAKRQHKMKKRRIRKLKRENRIKMKRSRFYPRPLWLGSRLYQKFWKIRFNDHSSVYRSTPSLLGSKDRNASSSFRAFKGYRNFMDENLLFTPVIQSNEITSSVVRELKTVLSKPMLKKGPYRDLLSSYLKKVTISLNQMKKSTRSMELVKGLKYVLNSSIFQLNPVNASVRPHTSFSNQINYNSQQDLSSLKGNWNTIINFSSYNENVKKRIQLYVMRMRENLTLNGNIKVRSSHIYPLQAEEKGYFQTKNSSTLPLSSLMSSQLRLNPTSRLRLYWAFSKVNGGNRLGTVGKVLKRETYYNKRSDLWINATKAREQTKDNKTRKLLRDIKKKFIIFINNEQKPLSSLVIPNNLKMNKINAESTSINNQTNFTSMGLQPIDTMNVDISEKHQWSKLMLSKAISKTRLKQEKLVMTLGSFRVDENSLSLGNENRLNKGYSIAKGSYTDNEKIPYLNLVGRNSRHWWVMNNSFLKHLNNTELTKDYSWNNYFGVSENLNKSCYSNNTEKRNLFNQNTNRINETSLIEFDNLSERKFISVQGLEQINIVNSVLFHFCSIITLLCITQIRDFIKLVFIGVKKVFSLVIIMNNFSSSKMKDKTELTQQTENSSRSFGWQKAALSQKSTNLSNGAQNISKKSLNQYTSLKKLQSLNLSIQTKGEPKTVNGLTTFSSNFINNVHFYHTNEWAKPIRCSTGIVNEQGMTQINSSGSRGVENNQKLVGNGIHSLQSLYYLLRSTQKKTIYFFKDLNSSKGQLGGLRPPIGSPTLIGEQSSPISAKALIVPNQIRTTKSTQSKHGASEGNSNSMLKNKTLVLYSLLAVNNLSKGIFSMYYTTKTNLTTKQKQVKELTQASVRSVYTFLEKPGELIVDWIAYLFLVEWASDLTNILPFSFDNKVLGQPFWKMTRTVYSLNLVNTVLSFLLYKEFNSSGNGNLSNFHLMNQTFKFSPDVYISSTSTKTTSLLSPIEMNNSFISILGYLYSTRLQRGFSNFYSIFLQAFYKPDTDILYRQRKGIVFWDIWGDFLTTTAEKNNINVSELTSLKEEQIKLLSAVENSFSPIPGLKSFSNSKNNSFFNSEYGGTANKNKNQIKNKSQFLGIRASGTIVFGLRPKSSSFLLKNRKLKNGVKEDNQTSTDYLFENSLSLNNNPNMNYFSSSLKNDVNNIFYNDKGKTWGSQQFLSYAFGKKDIELFIDLHPPTSLVRLFGPNRENPNSKKDSILQGTIGPLVCQIFSGTFTNMMSKNILVIGNNNATSNGFQRDKGLQKTLLVQAIAGETELKIITDSAHRYALVYRGVAVGIKLLRDVFDSLSLQSPCIFLLEDIHAIGEKRPLLISDDDNSNSHSGKAQNVEIHEKNQVLYQLSKHVITHYKKPYKGDYSLLIPSNHFCFDFFSMKERGIEGISSTLRRTTSIAPFSVSEQKGASNKEENKEKNTTSILPSRLLKPSSIHLAPPATSPFSVLTLKEEKKFQMNKNVLEMAWGVAGSTQMEGSSLNAVSKAAYSIRVKVALLADMALSSLTIKLDMITDLLVIIDSVKGNRGFVVFATTHIPSILDPALRRPGRLDETISLSQFSGNNEHQNNPILSITKYSDGIFNDPTVNGSLVKSMNRNLEPSFSFNSHYSTSPLFTNLLMNFQTFGSSLDSSLNLPSLKLTLSKGWLSARPMTYGHNINNQKLSSMDNIHCTDQRSVFSMIPLQHETNTSMSLLNKKMSSTSLAFTKTDFNNPLFKKSKLGKNWSKNTNGGAWSSELSGNTHSVPTFSILQSSKPKILSQVYYNACLELSSTFYTNSGSTKKSNETNLGRYESSFDYTLLKADSLKDKWYLYGNTQTLKTNLSLLISIRFVSEFLVFKKLTTITPFIGNMLNNDNKNFNFNDNGSQSWKSIVSLALSFVHKRIIYNQTLIVPKLLDFTNNNSLMAPPSPPISNILLPAKRYENYKRSFAYLKNKTNSSPGENTNINSKINYHSQQRLVKRLYGIPLKESFKSELIEKRLTNFSNAAFMIGGISSSFFQKPTTSNWFVRNRILKRHQNYLTNQWWNCQLPEYNAETTFLSDIDWRYTFVSSLGGKNQRVGDILLDFPDAEQYYNPRNRRWALRSGSYATWFSIFTGRTSDSKLSTSELYSHFIYDSIIKAFNTYEQNREILDYYAYSISNNGALVTETTNDISRLTQRKRFFR